MIKVENGTLEMSGELSIILSEVRAIIEALSEAEQLNSLFDEHYDFFKPTTSNERIKEIIEELVDKV